MMGGIDIVMDKKRFIYFSISNIVMKQVSNFKATGDCLIIANVYHQKKHIDEIIEKAKKILIIQIVHKKSYEKKI